MMNYETFYQHLTEILVSIIPDRRELVHFISNALNIDHRAASRRLRGEYQFRIDEVLKLCSLLDISLDMMIPKRDSGYYPPSILYYPFEDLSEKGKNPFLRLLEKYKAASKEKGSYVLMSCNILPDILCFQYENLLKYFIYKWKYFMTNMPSKNVAEERYELDTNRIYIMNEYINTIFSFEKLLIIWDKNIIPSIINDIKYYSETGFLNTRHCELVKKDLFSLIEQINRICENDMTRGNGSDITFAISATYLPKSHMLVKGNDFKMAIDSAFYTTYLYVYDPLIVESVEHIINSTLTSSVIISQSNEKERLKFISEQKRIIETI